MIRTSAALAALLGATALVAVTAGSASATPTHAAHGGATGARAGDCTVTVMGDGVNLHTRPTLGSTTVAQLQSGQTYTSPGCSTVQGDAYGPQCGAHVGSSQWRAIVFNGATRYFVAECGNVF